jgi:hypothetical protein
MPSSDPLACPAARRRSEAAAWARASASSNELKALTRSSTALVRPTTDCISSTDEIFPASRSAASAVIGWK